MAKKTLYDEDGNPVEVDFQDDNDNGPAELRKALKKAQTERDNDAKELATLKAELQASRVKDVLDKKGVPAKVAKFIPADVTTSDQIDSWLSENADVFGFTLEQPEAQDDAQKENAAKFKRINDTTQTAIQVTKDTDLLAKLNDPNLTRADLDAMREGDGPTGPVRRRY